MEDEIHEYEDTFNERYGETLEAIFEEIHNDLKLTYRYQWSSSNLFGFVKNPKRHEIDIFSIKINMLYSGRSSLIVRR